MTPDDIFLFAINKLTGGFVTDWVTAIFGLITLLVIMAGIDLLKDLFERSMANRQAGRNFEKAGSYLGMRDASGVGSAEYDYYNALYKAHLNKSVALSSKTGKSFSADEPVNHGGAGFNPLFESNVDTSDQHEIDFPQDYTFIGNDVFYGAQYDSGSDHEVDFDGEVGSPGLYQKHIRDKYL